MQVTFKGHVVVCSNQILAKVLGKHHKNLETVMAACDRMQQFFFKYRVDPRREFGRKEECCNIHRICEKLLTTYVSICTYCLPPLYHIGCNLQTSQKDRIKALETMIDNGSGLMAGQPNRTARWIAEDFTENCLDTFEFGMTVDTFIDLIWQEEELQTTEIPVAVRETGRAQLEAMGYYSLRQQDKHSQSGYDEGFGEGEVARPRWKQTTIDLTCTDPHDKLGIALQSCDPDYAVCQLLDHPVTSYEHEYVRHEFTLDYLKKLRRRSLNYINAPETILPNCLGVSKAGTHAYCMPLLSLKYTSFVSHIAGEDRVSTSW